MRFQWICIAVITFILIEYGQATPLDRESETGEFEGTPQELKNGTEETESLGISEYRPEQTIDIHGEESETTSIAEMESKVTEHDVEDALSMQLLPQSNESITWDQMNNTSVIDGDLEIEQNLLDNFTTSQGHENQTLSNEDLILDSDQLDNSTAGQENQTMSNENPIIDSDQLDNSTTYREIENGTISNESLIIDQREAGDEAENNAIDLLARLTEMLFLPQVDINSFGFIRAMRGPDGSIFIPKHPGQSPREHLTSLLGFVEAIVLTEDVLPQFTKGENRKDSDAISTMVPTKAHVDESSILNENSPKVDQSSLSAGGIVFNNQTPEFIDQEMDVVEPIVTDAYTPILPEEQHLIDEIFHKGTSQFYSEKQTADHSDRLSMPESESSIEEKEFKQSQSLVQ